MNRFTYPAVIVIALVITGVFVSAQYAGAQTGGTLPAPPTPTATPDLVSTVIQQGRENRSRIDEAIRQIGLVGEKAGTLDSRLLDLEDFLEIDRVIATQDQEALVNVLLQMELDLEAFMSATPVPTVVASPVAVPVPSTGTTTVITCNGCTVGSQ